MVVQLIDGAVITGVLHNTLTCIVRYGLVVLVVNLDSCCDIAVFRPTLLVYVWDCWKGDSVFVG